MRTADGKKLRAEVAGRDPRLDVVLLRVAGLADSALAFSSAPTPTGSLALVVGRTWAGRLQARLTALTDVTGPVRSWGGAPLNRLLSLDVGPYAGFSGSAIVLPDGGLAGIATAGIFRGQGLGIPAAILRDSVEALEQHGSVKRGYLGVTSQPVRLPERQRAGTPRGAGLLVLGVAANSPADAAGVLVGDILVGFDGHDLDDPETLVTLLTADRVGREVPLAVVRGGAPAAGERFRGRAAAGIGVDCAGALRAPSPVREKRRVSAGRLMGVDTPARVLVVAPTPSFAVDLAALVRMAGLTVTGEAKGVDQRANGAADVIVIAAGTPVASARLPEGRGVVIRWYRHCADRLAVAKRRACDRHGTC